MNPNNLIRPPVLNANPNPNPNPNPNAEPALDLTQLDRIPDVVKCIREFSGNKNEFASWKKSVDRVLAPYETIRNTPRFTAILNVIRNKIIGDADIALESFSTPLVWEEISRCLTSHYADKRDIGTLEYQMASIYQGNQTVQQFYQLVYKYLSLILNKISCMTIGEEGIRVLTMTYRNKALDTFIRGLNGDLPRLLAIREPEDLPEALYLCEKLENQNMRTVRKTHNPQPQPTTYNRNYSYRNMAPVKQEQRQFVPNFQNNEYFNQTYQRKEPMPYQEIQFPPPRPTAPKPFPKPTPMEVDGTIHSKHVNYMNRPNQQQVNKRPMNFSAQHPQKYQRNFHIDTNEEIDTNNDNQEELESLQEYIENYVDEVETKEEQVASFSDIHFLE